MTAYERTKPVCTLRTTPLVERVTFPAPFTAPSTTLASNKARAWNAAFPGPPTKDDTAESYRHASAKIVGSIAFAFFFE